MPAFFITAQDITSDGVTISGDLLRHLRSSLRLKLDETLYLTDDRRRRLETVVTELSRDRLKARIVDVAEGPRQSTPPVILAQAVLKGDHMDWIVQKATELGVETIVPVIAHRGVVRPDPDRIASQTARWQRIAHEAAQQSEQWRVPTVGVPRPIREFFTTPGADTRLMLHERAEGVPLLQVGLPAGPEASVALVVGPEGGWEPEESALAREQRFQFITLGSAILRSETAALAALAVLQCRLGSLE
jgi:16S rRNA (uracil1498-N3)-methyltransferase